MKKFMGTQLWVGLRMFFIMLFTLTPQISPNKHINNNDPVLDSQLQLRLLEDNNHKPGEGELTPGNLGMCQTEPFGYRL